MLEKNDTEEVVLLDFKLTLDRHIFPNQRAVWDDNELKSLDPLLTDFLSLGPQDHDTELGIFVRCIFVDYSKGKFEIMR